MEGGLRGEEETAGNNSFRIHKFVVEYRTSIKPPSAKRSVVRLPGGKSCEDSNVGRLEMGANEIRGPML
jgi:hypothetical protein